MFESDFDKWRAFQMREERRQLVCKAIVVGAMVLAVGIFMAHTYSAVFAQLAHVGAQ